MKVAQSYLTLYDPMDYTIHGILQARILGWVAFPFSRLSSPPRDQTQVSHTASRFFTSWATREACPRMMERYQGKSCDSDVESRSKMSRGSVSKKRQLIGPMRYLNILRKILDNLVKSWGWINEKENIKWLKEKKIAFNVNLCPPPQIISVQYLVHLGIMFT